MIPPSILFFWGKGAETRRRILRTMEKWQNEGKPCFLATIAKEIGISHVAAKKHVDLLVEEGYIRQINPGGKPVFLELTCKGKKALEMIR